MHNPFTNKNLRSLYDPALEKWWFSAVDICAILLDGTYEDGREYWKKIKYDLSTRKNQPVGKSDQLKMPAKNGKYYFTDVLDIKQVLHLILTIPCPTAEPFRLWIIDMLAENTPVENYLVEAGQTCAQKIAEKYLSNPQKFAARHTVTRRRLV